MNTLAAWRNTVYIKQKGTLFCYATSFGSVLKKFSHRYTGNNSESLFNNSSAGIFPDFQPS